MEVCAGGYSHFPSNSGVSGCTERSIFKSLKISTVASVSRSGTSSIPSSAEISFACADEDDLGPFVPGNRAARQAAPCETLAQFFREGRSPSFVESRTWCRGSFGIFDGAHPLNASYAPTPRIV